MIVEFITVLFALLACHGMADYSLQNDFIAKAKNKNTDIGAIFWPHVLFAHSSTHGLFVFLFTGSIILGLAETMIHAVTDYAKCQDMITLKQDQVIHYVSKVLWAVIVVTLLTPPWYL